MTVTWNYNNMDFTEPGTTIVEINTNLKEKREKAKLEVSVRFELGTTQGPLTCKASMIAPEQIFTIRYIPNSIVSSKVTIRQVI